MFMGDLWGAAGLLAIPVLILGGVALLFAIQHARTRRRDFFALAVGTTAATMLTSLLGTIMGFQMALGHLSTLAPDRRWLVQIGILESMNDLVLGLVFAIVVTVILTATVARARSVPESKAERATAAI